MIYDEQLFQKFRALAVTDPLMLVEGKTYYSNSCPASFTVREVISPAELHRRKGYDGTNDVHPSEDETLGWIVHGDNLFCSGISSLHDRNIGASYNPWLVFDNENLAKACRELLVISFSYS